MLKLGNMDTSRTDRLGALAAHVVEHALASGLTWDEAIIAFGIAAKAIAAQAAVQGSGTLDDCVAHARSRLDYGMDQGADVLKAYLS
jgi:hypothetical protein